MCGIAGLIDTVDGCVAPGLLDAMAEALIHRGPDGHGHYVDGAVGMTMRRLSIIDLEGGWQPFFSREGQVVAFQNGEIYNYRELRHRLEARGWNFTSQSDTEVLAHGYAEWGADGLLNQLDGMYAIAILDRDSRELHLARDRFGEKPLFYTFSSGRFAYSSSLLVLASLPWVDNEIDVESLQQYLAVHYVAGDATIFKAIKRALPGERLVVPIGDPTPRRFRYYSPPFGQQRTSDGALAELIEASVESRLVADVPVGIFLSGGIDSSIVASIAAKKQPNIATFSMGFKSSSHDESPFARLVAHSIGSNHHHFVFDEQSFRALLPEVVAALDEPVGDQAMLPLFWLCREAHRHVTVALSGEGADEVFGGYGYYNNHLSRPGWRLQLKARLRLGASSRSGFQRFIDNAQPATPSGFPLLTDIAGRERFTGVKSSIVDQWEGSLIAWLNQSHDSLQRASATDIATWLPDDLLVKFDRMSMAHSLEGRAPYLNPKLVESGLSLPQSQKMDGVTSKIALRRVAARWLPKEILDRPKQGFVLPMGRWLAQWFEAQVSVRDYFLQRPVAKLDMNEVALVVEEDLTAGVQRERLLFALVLLIEWYQSFQSKRYQLARTYDLAAKSEVGA